MIRVKMLRGNETVIIDNGKSYIFDLGGRCIKEDAGDLVSHMAGAMDLPVISILSSNGYSEVGVSFPGTDKLRSFVPNCDPMQCALTVQMERGFLKMLQRSGQQLGVRFNQMIFVYREGYDLMPLLKKLGCQEV